MKFSRFLFAVCAIASLSGCVGTVTPKKVYSQSASYDGNDQNSGVLSISKDGGIVTGDWRARYNALIVKYGRSLTSPITSPDAGLMIQPDGTYHATLQTMVNMAVMNDWRRMGRAPLK